MSNHEIITAINNVNDKYLNEAIAYQSKKKIKFRGLPMLASAAACLCLMLGLGAHQYDYHYHVDSVVDIDVNPSIELTVSKAQRVLSATALNEDAEIVLEGMMLENVDLETAMNAIVGSLLKNGYLDEVYNAINVCVENDDEEAGEVLGQKLKEEITLLLDENELLGKVQTQTTVANKDATKEAETYGVSAGKLALAKQVSECTGTELEEAVELSITELWDLSDAESTELITKEAALKIAYADAGVDGQTVVLGKNVIEETEGTFIYIIEFVVNENGYYKYKVDAEDGTILERTYEEQETEEEIEVPEDSEVELLAKKGILQIVYADAGVTEDEVRLRELKLENGETAAYRIEFSVGRCEYEYLVNALDGTIISKEIEDVLPEETEDEEVEQISPVKLITEQEALQIALTAAGVEQDAISKLSIKFRNRRMQAEYSVQFFVNEIKYQYSIEAVTGEIINIKDVHSSIHGRPEDGMGEKPSESVEDETIEAPSEEPSSIPEEKPSQEFPGFRPGKEQGKDPEEKPGTEQEILLEGKPGRFPDGEKEEVEEETQEESTLEEKEEIEQTEAFPMGRPDGDKGKNPNDNPNGNQNGQWESIPNQKPENNNHRGNGQFNRW